MLGCTQWWNQLKLGIRCCYMPKFNLHQNVPAGNQIRVLEWNKMTLLLVYTVHNEICDIPSQGA